MGVQRRGSSVSRTSRSCRALALSGSSRTDSAQMLDRLVARAAVRERRAKVPVRLRRARDPAEAPRETPRSPRPSGLCRRARCRGCCARPPIRERGRRDTRCPPPRGRAARPGCAHAPLRQATPCRHGRAAPDTCRALRRRRRLAADEARRAPGRDLPQIDDRRRHGLAEIEQRSHAVFLDRPVVAHRRDVPRRLGQRLRRADERADDLAHGAEIQPLQVRLHRRRFRETPPPRAPGRSRCANRSRRGAADRLRRPRSARPAGTRR